MSDVYTLTETHTRPDGQICALFRVTRPGGGYDYRITGPDLKSIYARLGIQPVEPLPPAPEPPLSNARTIENLAVSNV